MLLLPCLPQHPEYWDITALSASPIWRIFLVLAPALLSRYSVGIQRHLGDLRKRRDGYLELAADGLMPHAELSQKLRPLDAQIATLAVEVE